MDSNLSDLLKSKGYIALHAISMIILIALAQTGGRGELTQILYYEFLVVIMIAHTVALVLVRFNTFLVVFLRFFREGLNENGTMFFIVLLVQGVVMLSFVGLLIWAVVAGLLNTGPRASSVESFLGAIYGLLSAAAAIWAYVVGRQAEGNKGKSKDTPEMKKLREEIERLERNIADFEGADAEERPEAAFLYDAALRDIGPARDRLAKLEKEMES